MTKTKPWNHQIDAFNLAKDKPGFLLAHDMGTGKSKTAIDLLNANDARLVLIICPLSVVSVWPTQFERHSDNPWRVLCLDQKLSVDEKAEKARDAIRMAKKEGVRLAIVVNYESAWRDPLGPKYEAKIRLRRRVGITDRGLLLQTEWDYVICDESHRIKRPAGRASKFCALLKDHAKHRLCLTGTPMPHTPLDIWAQYRFLDPGVFGISYFAFKNEHAVMGGFEMKEFRKIRNPDKFNALVYKIAHRVRKEDVLDLPPLMHETRTCELSTKAARVYRELEDDLYTKIDSGEVTIANALVKLLRLQQLTGGWLTFDDGGMEQLDLSKQTVYTELIDSIGKGEPTVTFCKFRNDIVSCKNALLSLERGYAAELSGSRNDLADWQAGEYLDLVVQIQAGGVGIDLTRACYVVYFSKGFSLGDYEQSMARAHRPGQTRPVTVYHLEADGTVDKKVSRALMERKDVVEEILRERRSKR